MRIEVPANTRNLTRPARLLLIGIFLLAVCARLVPGPRTIDDSYITYRYARNILSGYGFVYNPGEQVMGTTTPLYTGLMTLGGLLLGGAEAPFPQIALILNALADAAVCLLLVSLGRRLGFQFAGWGAALVWAIAPFSVTFAIGGLETSVYILLLIGAAAAHNAERRILAALLGAGALLTRPDALILIGPLALDRLWQGLQQMRRGEGSLRGILPELLAFGVPTGAWLVFATAYFGSPIPHSIAAKTLAYRLAPEAGFVRLLQHYATPFQENHTFGIYWIAAGLILHPFLYWIGARYGLKRSPRLWPLAAYPWLYLAVFSLANPLIFRWYLTPPLPAYMLFILGGMETILLSAARGLQSRFQPKTGFSARLTAAVGILVILTPFLLSLRGWQIHPDHGPDRPAPEMAWFKLELLYRQAAESLLEVASREGGFGSTLAAGDVGVLGFTTGMHILDTVGLNSPQTPRYYPLDPAYYVINYAVPPRLILDELPDYIVILEVYGREGLFKDPAFWERYRLIQKIPTDIYGSDGMYLLARVQP